ncbi:MAG: RluA family pseudouridine synthase [Streptococcaceae bacterium]|jgi:23S rRNA pseudouridine1911/1915/1917 synthase|nr:RluA family pseudouridine synthase [Streptococcaceae bacterium]
MKITIQLPATFQEKDIRELLEKDWLVPRKVRHFLRTRKNVQVNNQPKMFHEKVYANDIITLFFEEEDYPNPEVVLGDKEKVEVLYEDDQLIIVNKPVGIKTHPNQPMENGTMFNHLAAYLHKKGQIPYVVHRLDKETSGAILFAKNPFILPILGRMLENKDIHRTYQAIVRGKVKPNDFTINKKIGRDRHDRRKRIIDERKGDIAITHVHVEKFEQGKSFLSIILDTGRTHQIRVHLLSIKHPILGDPLYNPTNDERLMLHARQLSFTHPFTNEEIVVNTNFRLF